MIFKIPENCKIKSVIWIGDVMMGEKHREERIEEILNAATEVFLEKGYSNTTMEDIINATTLSKGGFYYYFKSTKEIFFKILDKRSNTEIKFIESLDKNMTKEEIIQVICEELAQSILERFDERTLYMMTISEVINDPDFRKYYFQMVDKYLRIMEKSLLEKLPQVDPVIFEDRLKFVLSVCNAMTVYCYIYREEDLYKRNMDDVKNIFRQILSGI